MRSKERGEISLLVFFSMYAVSIFHPFIPSIYSTFHPSIPSSNHLFHLPTIYSIFQPYIPSSNHLLHLPTIYSIFHLLCTMGTEYFWNIEDDVESHKVVKQNKIRMFFFYYFLVFVS